MKKKNPMQITMGIALAIILFALVNLGVYTFYPSPSYDNFCDEFARASPLDGDLEIDPCYAEYDTARENYNNNVFYVYVILGLALAIAGLFIIYLPFQIVGIGTGTALIIEGIMRNLENKIPAFIAGVIAFAILAYFVWKKVK